MARPTLPRLRRGRVRGDAGDVVERTEPRVSELSVDGLTWVHAERPGALEVAYLAERFGFHELDIEDVLSKRQRPKIDEYPDYLFVVLHFPFYDKSVRRLNAAELDVFLGQDFLITLPNAELLPVRHLFRRCEDDVELRQELFRGSGYLLYHVLDDLFDYCFPILDKIGAKLDQIEPAIFEERSEDVVRDISNAKQEIIAYRKIIKPERATLRMLERSTERFLPEDLDLYFDDIVDAAERIWDLLDNYKEVIEGLESIQRVVHLAQAAVPAPAADGRHGDPAAPDAGHRPLRHERGRARRGRARGVLGARERHGRHRPRAARALPLASLAVSAHLVAPSGAEPEAAGIRRGRRAAPPGRRALLARPQRPERRGLSRSSATTVRLPPARRRGLGAIRAAAQGRRLRRFRLPRRLRIDAGRRRPCRSPLFLLRAVPRHGATATHRRRSTAFRAKFERDPARFPEGALLLHAVLDRLVDDFFPALDRSTRTPRSDRGAHVRRARNPSTSRTSSE